VAVLLSDRNLLSNAAQIAARIAFTPRDRVLNALPASDALGLTAGLLLPLLSGAETRFAAPSAEFGQRPVFRGGRGPTLVVGSDAFLAAYAGAAEAEELAELRTILADGAALRAETARLWADRPGTAVLEAFVRPEAAWCRIKGCRNSFTSIMAFPLPISCCLRAKRRSFSILISFRHFRKHGLPDMMGAVLKDYLPLRTSGKHSKDPACWSGRWTTIKKFPLL
jgi:acyl-CoA synthetase (AMP-forming)/AMP-acid ligase II